MKKKWQSGFTLIEITIVVVIIAVLASIAMANILSAKRVTREKAAFATVKNFLVSGSIFSNQNDSRFFWETNTTDFGDFFHHTTSKNGYIFEYISSDTTIDNKHEALRFVYVGYPINSSNGTRMFYVDEANRLWRSEKLDEVKIANVNALDLNSQVNFSIRQHLQIPGITLFEQQ